MYYSLYNCRTKLMINRDRIPFIPRESDVQIFGEARAPSLVPNGLHLPNLPHMYDTDMDKIVETIGYEPLFLVIYEFNKTEDYTWRERFLRFRTYADALVIMMLLG